MGLLSVFGKDEEKQYVKKSHFYSLYKWTADIFAHFREEGVHMREWLSSLHERTNRMEEEHRTHRKATDETLSQVRTWITYLHRNSEKTKEDFEKTKEVLRELYQNHRATVALLEDMRREHAELQRQVTQFVSQSVTKSVTKSVTDDAKSVTATRKEQGGEQEGPISCDTLVTQNVTHMTQEEQRVTQDVSQKEEKRKDPAAAGAVAMASQIPDLNISEKRILYYLLNQPQAQTYQTLADKLEMNYSTVKNIIYRLRKRRFPIQDTINRHGEKEFYLPESVKLVLRSRVKDQ